MMTIGDDDDRRKFVDLLACAVVRFGWILHDWCLLSEFGKPALVPPASSTPKQ